MSALHFKYLPHYYHQGGGSAAEIFTCGTHSPLAHTTADRHKRPSVYCCCYKEKKGNRTSELGNSTRRRFSLFFYISHVHSY